MPMELSALVSGVGWAVQQAQANLERQSIDVFCSYFNQEQDAAGPTLAPACRRFTLPDGKGGARQTEVPEAALVHHSALALDTVRVEMNILPTLDEVGGVQVEVGPGGEEVEPMYSRLELTFRAAPAAEGEARISQSTVQYL